MALYIPTDVDAEHEAWGANCGPCAVAALLGCDVCAVRGLFEAAKWPGYTNPTMMRTVLQSHGRRVTTSTEASVQKGLGFIQFEGPWEKGGARAAYRHTHWVALRRGRIDGVDEPVLFVYDNAAADYGTWVTLWAYGEIIIPMYLEGEPRATGWRFRQVLEVA